MLLLIFMLIIFGARSNQIKVGSNVEISCEVVMSRRHTGSMVLCCDRYEWRRNGVGISLSSTAADSGTKIINEPTSTDEGVYQCFARNGVGIAMSNTTLVMQAQRASFSIDSTVYEARATVGKPLTLDCQPTRQSIPSPTFNDFTWKTDSVSWPLSQRAQIDDSGMYHRLLMSYLTISYVTLFTARC